MVLSRNNGESPRATRFSTLVSWTGVKFNWSVIDAKEAVTEFYNVCTFIKERVLEKFPSKLSPRRAKGKMKMKNKFVKFYIRAFIQDMLHRGGF